MQIVSDMSIPDAARELGVSEQTIRRRIRRGDLPATRIARAQGYEYRVQVPPGQRDQVQVVTGLSADRQGDQVQIDTRLSADRHPDQVQIDSDQVPDSHDQVTLATVIAEQSRQITRLNDERAELYGRIGYYQAQIEQANAKILALSAPVDPPAATEAPAVVDAEPVVIDVPANVPESRPWWKVWR